MWVGIKVVHVAFIMVCATEFENFVLVNPIDQLTIHRLSGEVPVCYLAGRTDWISPLPSRAKQMNQ